MSNHKTRVACPKCGGTGSVPFDYKGGVCFDCGGTGTVEAAPTAKPTSVRAARLSAEAAIAAGDKASAATALEGLKAFQLGWRTKDYALQSALIDIINAN